MATTDAQKRARDKWLKDKVEALTIRVEKGKKEAIKRYAAKQGESLNAFVNRAIEEAMKKE